MRVPLAVSALVSDEPDGGCMPSALSMMIDDDVASPSGGGGGGGGGSGGGGLTFVTRSAEGSAGGYKTHNPHYLRLGYLRSLEQFVTTLGDYGLLVMLDLHAGVAGRWPDDGKEHAPGNLKRAWSTLAGALMN